MFLPGRRFQFALSNLESTTVDSRVILLWMFEAIFFGCVSGIGNHGLYQLSGDSPAILLLL
jgi:hypothetical protein